MVAYISMQQDLDKLYEWVDRNNTSLNGEKFQHLHAGKSGQYSLFLNNEQQIIRASNNVRDLGIYFSSDLKFRFHINTIVQKAQRVAHWVLRTFKTRQTFPMLILLKTVIVPLLEYACVVWSPSESALISLIERIQKKFTSKFQQFNTYDETLGLYTCHTDYWQRLKLLKIYSLERRRERYMILFLYKICIGTYPNPGLDLSTLVDDPRTGITIAP